MKSINAALVIFTVILISISITITAAASGRFQYDGFSEYGQITHDVYIDSDGADIDGVISEGEYACEPIKLTASSAGVYFADWTDAGLPDDVLYEVLPESVTYYVTYNETGLFIAAEIVDKNHYGNCGEEIQNLWGVDSLAIDISIDAYGDISSGRYTQKHMLDRTRINYGLIEDSSGMLTNASYCYPVSSYGMFSNLESVHLDTYEISRNEATSTTVYEIFVSWFDLWLEEIAPERVFLNFQIGIAHEEYTRLAADGYIACLGGLRYSCKLSDEAMAENGCTSSSIYHVFELRGVNPDGEPTTESTTPAVTEEITEVTEVTEVTPTEAISEEITTEIKTEEKTEEKTDVKTEEKTEVKTEVKTEEKTEAKTEVKTEEKTESQSNTTKGDKGDDKTDATSGCSSSLGAFSAMIIIFSGISATLLCKHRKDED